ncbi:MAG TPA: hypothetical protein VFT50_08905 [Baekduia sp.]|nr:hypothetical protein [Baekduia sp.]
MPSTDTPTWWADVQQEREDLRGRGRGRRPADDWLGEDIDFVPRRRIAGDETEASDADHPLHGVFVAAPAARAERTIELEVSGGGATAQQATARVIELEVGGDRPARRTRAARTIELEISGDTMGSSDHDRFADELRHLHAADDPFAVPPPASGTRRTVQITGRPGETRVASQAQRHRPRTTSDRVGHRPDRVALWAVLLGAILILLAATSSSQAATVPAAAPAAKVVHVTPAPAAPPTIPDR